MPSKKPARTKIHVTGESRTARAELDAGGVGPVTGPLVDVAEPGGLELLAAAMSAALPRSRLRLSGRVGSPAADGA
jgi:hypothetical protein